MQVERQRAEHELAQAQRLVEEAAKREVAERARAAAAEQAQKAAEEARHAQQARAQKAERARAAETQRAEAVERARRRQRQFSLALSILFVGGWITIWLWQKGYSVEQAMLKVRSFVVSIHVPPEMQPVAGGSFRQGDIHGRGDSSEQPVHEVAVKPFAIGKFEVTFEEYDRFAIAMNRPLPGDQGWGRGKQPVINVSWQDVKDYADWLSLQTGTRYRLATESEWEYAAQGGEQGDIWAVTSKESDLAQYAVYAANSNNRTAPVGKHEGRKPNALGLYDLSGNVFEWVEDCVHVNYKDAPSHGSAWLETQGGNCEGRIIRGGSWFITPGYLRTSDRFWLQADYRNFVIGFRLVQDILE